MSTPCALQTTSSQPQIWNSLVSSQALDLLGGRRMIESTSVGLHLALCWEGGVPSSMFLILEFSLKQFDFAERKVQGVGLE